RARAGHGRRRGPRGRTADRRGRGRSASGDLRERRPGRAGRLPRSGAGQGTRGAGALKFVLMGDDGMAVAEIEELEQYDLSKTRGRGMVIDDILVALGQADRRRVLNFMRDHPPEELSSVVTELRNRT